MKGMGITFWRDVKNNLYKISLKMGRKNLNKISINLRIDKELKPLLDKHTDSQSALINSLLWKFFALQNNNISLNSKPKAQNPIAREGFEPSTSGNPKIGEKGLELGERPNLSTREHFNLKKHNLYLVHDMKLFPKLKSIYKKEMGNVSMWLLENYSAGYERQNILTLNKLFNILHCNSIKQFRDIIEKKLIAGNSVTIAMRVFFNYLEQSKLLDEDSLDILRFEIKLIKKRGIDCKVPPKKQVIDSIKEIKKSFPSEYVTLYRFIIQSGCRFTELKQFILKFDNSKIYESEYGVITYENFFLRKQKHSYYLFFTKKLYKDILKIKDNLKEYDLDRFRDRIVRNKKVINVKYIRKFNFTLLVDSGITFEISDFVQGRSANKNIGYNHYLGKHTIAIKEYKKLLPALKEY